MEPRSGNYYTRDEVDRRDAEIREEARQAKEIARRNREDIDRILRCIEPNGRPGIEERMVAYTDNAFTEAERDYTQIGLNATQLIKENGLEVKETRKQVESLGLTMAKWGGAIGAATVAIPIIMHFWK